MTLTERFKEFIQQSALFAPKDTLLLAVSGGVDSVVLCELCKQAGFNFVIVHCNFQLRGEDSTRDAVFVEQLAKQYQVPFLKKVFDTNEYAKTHKLSIQEAARELRYGWFAELVGSRESGVGSQTEVDSRESIVGNQNNSDSTRNAQPVTRNWLLTAHHLDDNIETMVMHFFRGTGVQGLRGMLPKQAHIVRPLLFAHKETLKQFAESNGLRWVEDSSNALDKYARNYIRNQVIPLLQQIYPGVKANMAANLQRFADLEILYEQAVQLHKKKLLETKGNEVHIPVLKLQKAVPLRSIVYEIIKEYGFSAHQTDEVIDLLPGESGRYVQSATHRIIKNRKWLIMAPVQVEGARLIVIDEGDAKVSFENGELHVSRLTIDNMQLATSPLVASLDAKDIRFPLILRKWKQGDYFYPLGMKKKKKVARFLIDQKLSLTDKEKVWVLEQNKKILWVVGMRIDDRFKIMPGTQQVLQITLKRL